MAYRRTEKMQRRVEDRRKSILVAAEKLFAENGFEATTMKDITKVAKTSIGNLYFYFPNKEDLMLNLIDELIGEVWAKEFDAQVHGFEIDMLTNEAIDDYMKVVAFFSNAAFARNLLNIAQHRLFRKHILRFLEAKARERYQEYGDIFGPLDTELALSHQLGGLLNVFEKILSGELKRTPQETGIFLAESKLKLRGLPQSRIDEIMSTVREIIPVATRNLALRKNES